MDKNSEKELFTAILDIGKEVSELSGNLREIKTTLAQSCQLAVKHEDILYGDPREGNGGLINKVRGIGNKLDYIQNRMVLIWGGIYAVIQLAIIALPALIQWKYGK